MRVRSLPIYVVLPMALWLIASPARFVSTAGPLSVLYVMSYGEFGGGTVVGLDLFQGLSESSYPTGNGVDICIGVAGGDVRTMGCSATSDDSGGKRDG